MSLSVSPVTPAEVGIASGLLGASLGYVLAPRMYNLEQLLSQEADVFEKAIPEKSLLKATDVQKVSYQTIKEGRKTFMDAVKSNIAEVRLAELTRAPRMESAYKSVKTLIPKARAQSAIVFGFLAGVGGVVAKILIGPNN